MIDSSKYLKKISLYKSNLWEEKKPFLVNLDIELTERCNLNCQHCYINQPATNNKIKQQELSAERIKSILTEAASLGCLMVRFTGGEPLLRDDFEEIYVYARRLGLKVLLFTNATLITPRLAALFSRIPLLEKIEITFYGMKKHSYEQATRVPGSYEQARRGIGLLLEKKVPFVVKGALLPPNRDELEEFDKWVLSMPGAENRPSQVICFSLRCRRDSETRNCLIKKLRWTPGQCLEILKRTEPQYSDDMKVFSQSHMFPPGEKLFTCDAGLGKACVDAYGFLQPCMLMRHPDTIYNLDNGSIRDCLTNIFSKVRLKKAKNPDYLNHCAHCFLKGLCDMCPAQSWMEHGTLDTPVEYLCDVAHEVARYLGFIKKEEKAWEVNDWKQRIQRVSEAHYGAR